MQSWPAAEIPELPVTGPPVRVHDSSTDRLVETRPEGEARMYVCGITPYDATHLGHAATYLTFDLLQRAWLDQGHDVHYVQNVTDVDDPLLERATKVGVDWVGLAERETELFRQDMTALRVLPPHYFIGAVVDPAGPRPHSRIWTAAGRTVSKTSGHAFIDLARTGG